MLGTEIIILLIIVAGALVLFATEVIPVEVTAILIMGVLMATGLVSAEEGVAGFSNTATITILALLLVSEGVRQSGTVAMFSRQLMIIARRNRIILLPLIILIPAFLSAFINNTAVVAIFIPVYIRLAKRLKISSSVVLMPLSFACMAGGSATLIGSSTNLLVNSVAESYDVAMFSMFDFSFVGIVLVIITAIYLTFIGSKLIPKRQSVNGEMTEDFDTREYITEVFVNEGAPATKVKLRDTVFYREPNISLLAIVRDGGRKWLPDEVERIQEGDTLLIQADRNKLLDIMSDQDMTVRSLEVFTDRELSGEGGLMMEVMITPSSELAGKTLSSIDFRTAYGAIPLAIRRTRGKVKPTNFMDRKLRFGDVVLLQTKKQNIDRFKTPELLILNTSAPVPVEQSRNSKQKISLSIGITVTMVLLAATGVFPMVISAWLACGAMLVTGCLKPKEGFRNVPWSVFFLLAGIIPLGIAMRNTGTSDFLAGLLMQGLTDWNIYAVVAVIYLITVTLTSIMSNNATAILIAPIAIQLAINMGLPVDALLLTVLLGANSSFLTPIGYQTNTMVYKAGNYRFMDFVKVGGVLTLIYVAAIIWLIPMWAGA